jgi:hypothetical protein
MEEIKRIDLNEFMKNGYLQEVNRQFFHPLGLALEIIVEDDGKAISLGGIWDDRDSKEGIYYDIKNSDDERKKSFKRKAQYITEEMNKRKEARIELLGDIIEPIE